ncbi:MAG: filamentous hemagglutinin N-terminal domain-containing protein, partial [Alphaproteobacteria bacterium]|nr:filamentous hemagglutinin N-terminal domain-containing protein [Alphaproteobacteria bacterium]
MFEISRFPHNNNESKHISLDSPTPSKTHHRKTNFYRNLLAGTAIMLTIGVAAMSNNANAAPSGGVVTNGQAVISTDGNKTSIHQDTARAAINWAGFDVAANEKVEFIVPNKGATLNTISGSQTHIDGRISSNGTLYFVNQNGFVFGANSDVSAANVILSTDKINVDQFMANDKSNRQQFTASDVKTATISLNGTITTQDRGIVALFAPTIENNKNAVITAHLGTVALASGTVNTIDFNGDGLMKFELSDSGQGLSVTNNGRITAAGGQVILTAKRAKDFLNNVVTNNGMIDTEGEAGQSGKITLSAVNGVVKLGGGSINSGNKGDLILSQTANNADLTLDSNSLSTIKFAPGMNLSLISGRDVTINNALNLGNLSITAVRHIALNNTLTGHGNISLTAGGNILLYNTLSTDGNLVLTAKNSGMIAAAKA